MLWLGNLNTRMMNIFYKTVHFLKIVTNSFYIGCLKLEKCSIKVSICTLINQVLYNFLI